MEVLVTTTAVAILMAAWVVSSAVVAGDFSRTAVVAVAFVLSIAGSLYLLYQRYYPDFSSHESNRSI